MELPLPKPNPASGFRPAIQNLLCCSIPKLQGPAPPREMSHKQLKTGKRVSKYKAEGKHHHMCMGRESTACKPQGPSLRYSQGLRRDSKIQTRTCHHHQQQISQDCNSLSRQSQVPGCFSCHHKQEQGVSEYVISDWLVIMEVS